MSSSVESGLTVETIKLRPSHVALSRYDETMPFSAPNLESKLYRASSLIASKRLSSASSRCVGGNLHSQSTSQNSIFGRKTARMSAGDIGNSVNKMLPSRGDFGNLSGTPNGFQSDNGKSRCVLRDIAKRQRHFEFLFATVFLLSFIIGIILTVIGFVYHEHIRLAESVCGVILLLVGIIGTVKSVYMYYCKNNEDMKNRIHSREILKSKFEELLAEDEEREITATLTERSVVKPTS